MKQIPLLQGKAMIVELPEGATNLQLLTVHQGSKSFPSLKYDRPDLVRGFIDLPPGRWQIIGMLSEVREAEVANIMPYADLGDRKLFSIMEAYPNRMTDSAIEALESWILAEGYSFSNIEINPDDFKAGTFSSGEHQRLRDRFESAQSRVLDRSRCLLLGRDE